MFLRNNFLLYLTAIFIALTVIIFPNDAFANEESEKHNLQGDTYYNNGNYEAAIKEYQLAIEIEKKAEYYTHLGWSYYKLKEYTLAEENLNKAIQLDTKSGNAYRGLGLIYRDQLKNDEAENSFFKQP